MDIYCTRPRCEQPVNSFADLDDRKLLKTVHQRHCVNCGMPLILDGRYLPTQLLQQGGLGVAFLGCDRRTPGLRRCVIKQLQVNPSFNNEQVETASKLFHREAEVLEKLGEHPRIPRLFAFLELIASAAPPHTQQKFFYLVQEYIEGQNLEQELQARGRFTEPAVLYVLREVAKILEFIHFQGSIHRDIKPSNIMRDLKGQIYAIDFGAVKQIAMETERATGSNRSLTGVSTPEYAPWEQRQGQTIYPSSDLYALAVTCLNLLTGKPPQDLLAADTQAWQWRSTDLQVSDNLAEILDKMLHSNPTERFQSARDVLEALDDIYGIPVVRAANIATGTSKPVPTTLLLGTFEQEDTLQIESELPHEAVPTDRHIARAPILPETAPMQIYTSPPTKTVPARTQKPLPLVSIIVAASIGLVALLGSKLLSGSKAPIGEALAQRSSAGDRILLSIEGNRDTDRFKSLKRAGVLAIANKNYEQAVTNFQAALVENPNSPETRIYLNNALIGDRQSYTIATSAPIGRSLDRASEMLRGFAQAQSEMNQAGGVNDAKIKLRIVDDSDDPKTIDSIATDIAKQPEILGIVGHNRNDVTMKAATIYNREKLAFIAPISTANELTSRNKPYVFRTNARADTIVQKLVDRLIDTERKRRVAIFSVPTITYNDEFKNQFVNKLVAKGGQIVGMFQFSTVSSSASPTPTANPKVATTFDAETYLKQANAAGAEAILLLPVGRSHREAIQLLKIADRKYPNLSILTDTAMYSVNTLRAGKAAKGLVMGVPWQESDSTPQFANGAQQLWRDRVNWATATSYNAVKSMGTAIKAENSPSRQSVMTTLSKTEFTGAAGRFQFTQGEPTERYALVQVAPTPPNYRYSSRTGYDFVPID
jgi:ABC-type branched-subunit amino acid transport system substrate-binding protein/serine/threonine protein kinase